MHSTSILFHTFEDISQSIVYIYLLSQQAKSIATGIFKGHPTPTQHPPVTRDRKRKHRLFNPRWMFDREVGRSADQNTNVDPRLCSEGNYLLLSLVKIIN